MITHPSGNSVLPEGYRTTVVLAVCHGRIGGCVVDVDSFGRTAMTGWDPGHWGSAGQKQVLAGRREAVQVQVARVDDVVRRRVSPSLLLFLSL